MMLLLLLVVCFAPCGSVLAQDAAAVPLSPQEFLYNLRRPLANDAVIEYTGQITHRASRKKPLKANFRSRVTCTTTGSYTQLTINDRNVYGLEIRNTTGGKVTQHLDMPPKEEAPGLEQFGVAPSDLAFAFIYWDFVEELPSESLLFKSCRVLRLRSPENPDDTVKVFFEAEYGFPLRVEWYKPNSKSPRRILEISGVKRYSTGMWFVREMIISGDNWRTRVLFDYADQDKIDAKDL